MGLQQHQLNNISGAKSGLKRGREKSCRFLEFLPLGPRRRAFEVQTGGSPRSIAGRRKCLHFHKKNLAPFQECIHSSSEAANSKFENGFPPLQIFSAATKIQELSPEILVP